MANFIHAREYLQAGDAVVVTCNYACNICVMTDSEFANYQSRRSFRHLGGHYNRPVTIVVPHSDHWNTTIDLGGGSASNVRHSINYIKQT